MKYLFLILLCFISSAVYADQSAESIRKIPLKGTVSLTFDDGPSPIYTPQILSILKKNNIKATFFVVGSNAKAYPDMIKQIHAEGHVIASHSQTHPYLTKISKSQLENEISQPMHIVKNIIGIPPKCLRYPFGLSNEHVRNEIKKHGMMPVSMGFNSFDYERPGTEKIISWVIKNAHSQQVILMHDGYNKREQTVAALQPIIDGIRKKGLNFSTICS